MTYVIRGVINVVVDLQSRGSGSRKYRMVSFVMYHNKAVTTYVGTNLYILQGLNKAAFV